MKFIRVSVIIGITISSLLAHGQLLKSMVYDFDGADIGQTDLPEGDYHLNDLTYKAVANPTGSGEMLGDRVLELDLNWNAGNGIFGRGISRFIEFNPVTDIFNFYFYNPTTNSADASFDVAIMEDDDQSNNYSINSDDVWIKSLTVPRSSGWQLISIPLSSFTDGNAGGNGIFDATFTGSQGMLLLVEFRFQKNTTINETFFLDMICFSDGTLPTGATILDLPSPTMPGKCPLGAFEQKAKGDQYIIPSDIEGLFPSMPKKIKYVNWFLQFAMDGSTTAKELPGNEVSNLLAGGYRPIITWEPLFEGYARLDPVQPRLNNIINGDYDTYINSFADKIKSYNDTIVIRFMHEFEGNWYPWSLTVNNQDPNKYISAFRKVVDMFKARGATKVKWMWCLNSDYFPYLSYNWAVTAYPGDNYVDIVATDIYNNHYPTPIPWWRSFRWQTTESYYYLTKYFPNKPLIMCEEGCRERVNSENSSSETKAQWLTQMDKQLQTNYSRVKGLVFFSASNEYDWRINSSSSALNAMATNIWNDDYYFEGTIAPPPPTATCSATGTIVQEAWTNISGYSISSIPVTTAPSYTVQLNLFEEPSNAGDNYGSRVRGYICPPLTGNYIFWVASDDNSELWLSTDSTPANKTKIAYVSGWTSSREWTKYPSQQSAPISLTAGKKYYIESLHKEGAQGDNLAVGWQLPNGLFERPVPGSRLSPFESTPPPPTQDFILANSSWKYLDNGTNQSTAWRAPSFSDATWKTGNAELGYGDGDEATVVSYGGISSKKYITTYFRKAFNVTDASAITGLELSLVRDDGAVVYLNGTEVYRSNMPSAIITYSTVATNAINGSAESTWNIAGISKTSLVTGINLLAVEIHQNARTSSDISFNLKLKGLSAFKLADSTFTLVTTDSVNNPVTDFILYPNPSTGLFTMEYCNYNVKENSLTLEIVNSLGQVVFQKQIMKTNGCVKEVIEFGGSIPPGIYIMNVITGENKESRRIILSE